MRRMLLAVTMAACTGFLGCESEDLLEPFDDPDAAVLPAQGASAITVMTRNVYLGFDIDGVIAGTTPLANGLAELQATDFTKRAAALADEIAATKPQLIGLQEMIDYRYQFPGDFLTNFTPNATEPYIPFLYYLMQELAARNLDYDVAVNNPTTDVEVPVPHAQSPTGYMDVRYTDHDVILVRGDVEYSDATADLYEAMITFELGGEGGIPGSRPLGYGAVQAEVNGRSVLFVSTHLETQNSPDVQVAQIQELMAWLEDQDLPIILVGDLNSAANASAPEAKKTDTYGMLIEAGFHDVWLRAHPFEEGLTCCHATDLESANAFDQRLDLILLNDGADRLVAGVQTTIVGIEAFQSTQPKWASDHAGLVATLRLPNGR